MQRTRRRVMEYLEAHRLASAPELARALGMTRANLRHHLAALQEMGQVEVVGKAPSQGRGRPALLYMAARGALGHNLEGLASALLAELLAERPSGEREARLKRLAERLRGKMEASPASIAGRLFNAVARLNQLGYQARWEAHADSPRLILGRCPYAPIIDEHSELCRMDAQLLSALLDHPVEQTAKLARSPSAPPHCLFILQESQPK